MRTHVCQQKRILFPTRENLQCLASKEKWLTVNQALETWVI